MTSCWRYYSMSGNKLVSLLTALSKLKQAQGALDQFIVDEWQSNYGTSLGQALDELSKNAARFAPLDPAPDELQKAWSMLTGTMRAHAEMLGWATHFRKSGLTSPGELENIIAQLHKTKCLELLLPTPISGATKSNIVSLCRFLKKNCDGKSWILALECDQDEQRSPWRIG